MQRFVRYVAFAYAVAVALAAIWAWCVNLRMLHSAQEHLLPGVLLAVVSMPMSQSLGPLYDHWPAYFSGLMQLLWLTICGALQVAALFVLSAFLARPQREA